MKKLSGCFCILLVFSIIFAACGDGKEGNVLTTTSFTTSNVIYNTTVESTEAPVKEKAVNKIGYIPSNAIFNEENTYFVVSPNGLPNNGNMFVDHSISGNRGGHFGHAMVEYADGKILAFYPNCNADHNGHSGRGWMEYKRSEDYGKTWSKAYRLKYSYDTFVASDQERSIICEKAVVTDDGTIILFCLQCDVKDNALWEPYFEPTYITSTDGGYTWSEPVELSRMKGRIYDAHVVDGNIYVFAHLDGRYYMFRSYDGGKSFEEPVHVPMPSGNFYGTTGILPNGDWIAYTYSEEIENVLYYSLSSDGGDTWSRYKTTKFDKKIRNPQLIELNGSYFIMGRSGSYGSESGHNIIYFSHDGLNWQEGVYLSRRTAGTGAYSNAIVVGTFNNDVPNRILYQASKAYDKDLTNILHWWIDAYVVENSKPQFDFN